MTDFYEGLAAVTLRQIAEKGRAVTLRAPNIAFDPSDGSSTSGPSSAETKVLFVRYAEAQIDGTVIQRGDQECLVATKDLTLAPSTALILDDGTDSWAIKNVELVRPGPTPLFYRIQVRR